MLASLLVALALGQSSDPFVRSRVQAGNAEAQCLFWTVPTIRWQLSSVGNPKSTDTQKQNEFTAIRRSFQSWDDIFASCGNLRFSEGSLVDERKVGYDMKGDNLNLVLFRDRPCEGRAPSNDACWTDDDCGNVYDCWDGDERTIALTLTTYDEKSGIIYDSDIQLNANNFAFTTGTPVATDVQNTMTHEIGHLIGLDHTLASGSTMYPRAPPGETSKRTIDQGSRGFVCAAYPKGQPSQSCFTPVLDTSGNAVRLGPPAVGCSGTGSEAWLPAMAAWALLAWRRRQGGARP